MKGRNNKRSLALLMGYTLAGLIVLAMLFVALQMLGLLDLLGPDGQPGPIQTYLQGGELRSLQIQLHSDLILRTGPELKVEAQNPVDSFQCALDDGILTVYSKQPAFSWMAQWRGIRQQVIVTLPENVQLEEAVLTLGVGDLDGDRLETRTLELTGGVGDTFFRQLTAWESATISVGVGDMEILSGQLQNLDLDGGVGDFDCAAALLGQSTIKNGVGDMELTLPGSLQHYCFQIQKGIGDVELNGDDLKSGTYGDPTAPNQLNISSGVGDIEIELRQ